MVNILNKSFLKYIFKRMSKSTKMKKILFLVQVIILSISFFNCSKASKNITKETKIGQSMSVTEEGLRADELEKIGKAFLLTSISTDAEYGFSEKNQ